MSDGSQAYKTAISTRLDHARDVLDRFHVIRWFAASRTAVRRDVQHCPEGSKPRFDLNVFGTRFLLMRRPDTPTAPTPPSGHASMPSTAGSKRSGTPTACTRPRRISPRRACYSGATP